MRGRRLRDHRAHPDPGNGRSDHHSAAAGGETRYFAFKDDLAGPAVDARVWSGIHFRTADEVSIDIGTNVANYVLDRYFAPAH